MGSYHVKLAKSLRNSTKPVFSAYVTSESTFFHVFPIFTFFPVFSSFFLDFPVFLVFPVFSFFFPFFAFFLVFPFFLRTLRRSQRSGLLPCKVFPVFSVFFRFSFFLVFPFFLRTLRRSQRSGLLPCKVGKILKE